MELTRYMAVIAVLCWSLTIAGQTCELVSVTYRERNSVVIRNGVVQGNWITPLDGDDSFSFDLQNNGCGYTLALEVTPRTGVEILETSRVATNATHETYSFRSKCAASVSYRFRMEAIIRPLNPAFPSYSFGWFKVCGSGIAQPRRGFALTHNRHDHQFIVRDGFVADHNFLPGHLQKTAVGKHHTHLVFYLHLLPIPRTEINANITTGTIESVLLLPSFHLHYSIDPMEYSPPVLQYDESIVYPYLKGEGARGGVLNATHPHKLEVHFNCLGVETKTSLQLKIDVPMHLPVVLHIDKECSHETLLDRIEESIVDEEEKFGILRILGWILFVSSVVFVGVTACGMMNGKSLAESVPCGRSCVEWVQGLGKAQEERFSRPAGSELPRFPGEDFTEDSAESAGHSYGIQT